MDALNGVINSVPEWHTLLDNLNSQIALRQFELAELGGDRPPTRSLKPKGSTESLLRRKENDETPIIDDEDDENTNTPHDPCDIPALTRTTVFPSPSTSPKTTVPAISAPHGSPPRLFHHSSSPGPVPLQRRTSGRLNTPNVASKPLLPPVLRKRKTESWASGDSHLPKYRTRSMIIVYYDSAVQNAFEELVKLISGSRNAMRKGKMAARMADMKKMAEMETATDEDERSSTGQETPNGRPDRDNSPKNNLDGDTNDNELPKLEFVSTRRMGPSRDSPAAAALRGATKSSLAGPGRRMMLPGSRGTAGLGGLDSFSSIFDELDTGLEWCQSMCEHAAHQFLRDGNCDSEIAGIKRRLLEVKEIAEKESVKATSPEKNDSLKEIPEDVPKEIPNQPEIPIPSARSPAERRGMKSIQMRKSFLAMKSLGADNIEVDDEGYDDVLPTLQWRSAGAKVA
jgi:hypothetical protein